MYSVEYLSTVANFRFCKKIKQKQKQKQKKMIIPVQLCFWSACSMDSIKIIFRSTKEKLCREISKEQYKLYEVSDKIYFSYFNHIEILFEAK
jgi:hypothetical protein